jgi:hypothetical protein
VGKLIDTEAAAKKLGVSVRRVRVLCFERRIRGARFIGGRWFVPETIVVSEGTRGPALNSAKAKVLQKIRSNITKAEGLQRRRAAFETKKAKEK